MISEYEIPKRHAKKVLTDWLNNKMVKREIADPKRKKFGLRVIAWPGTAT